MKKYSIGIDFGTTFSLIYLFDGDRPEPVVYNCKTMFIPTKISYSYNSESQEDCWYYGFEAERDTERTTVIDVKRMLGMSAELPNLNDLIEEWKKLGIKIRSSNDTKCFPRDKIEIEFKRNDEDVFYMSPEKLAGNYIKYLVKEVAEVELNQNQKVVITIPANYSSNQRKATLDAARTQHSKAHILWEYWTAENSDGFHNPELARESLTQSINESMKGYDMLDAAMKK